MRILGIGRAPLHSGEVLGRRAAFRRLLDLLGAAHELRRVTMWQGRAPDPEPATRYVEGQPGTLWTTWAVRQEIRSFDPAVVIGEGPLPPPARRPSIAVVRDLAWTGWQEFADPRGFLLRRFRGTVVPTEAVRRSVQAFGVDPFLIHVIPEPLPDWGDVGVPSVSGPLVIAQIGAIHPAKRPHLTIDAISRLSAREKGRIRLVVAGPVADDRYLAQLRVQAEGQPVEFVADAQGMRGALGRASGVVYPTAVDEAWPDAAFSALAAGRPVWFSDRPQLRALLSGLAVPVGDGVAAWREVFRTALAGTLPAASATELHARFPMDEVRRRWREVLGVLVR